MNWTIIEMNIHAESMMQKKKKKILMFKRKQSSLGCILSFLTWKILMKLKTMFWSWGLLKGKTKVFVCSLVLY